MKKSTMKIALATALLSAVALQASEFQGGYVEGKIGYNKNSPTTSSTSNKIYPGIEAGYGWDIENILLGVDGFVDGHSKSVTGNDYGADVKLGFPMDRFMPYAKLGVAASDPGTRIHGGLGIEYKFAPQWSVSAEWTADSKSVNSQTDKNNNISIGLSYYFGGPAHVSPKVVVAPAPVVAHVHALANPAPVSAPVVAEPAPAPAPVAEPAPAPVYTNQVTEKKIVLEGTSFDTNSAKLKKSATDELNKAVQFAEEYKDSDLVLVGYTDNRGDAKKNLKLSEARAESVKVYLVKHGVAAQRLTTQGQGAADPVADNKTEAGRAKNRRVEVKSTLKTVSKVQVQ